MIFSLPIKVCNVKSHNIGWFGWYLTTPNHSGQCAPRTAAWKIHNMPKISASPCPARPAATGSGSVAPYRGAASGGTRWRTCGAWWRRSRRRRRPVTPLCVVVDLESLDLEKTELREAKKDGRHETSVRRNSSSKSEVPTLYYIGQIITNQGSTQPAITKPKISSKHCCEVLLLTLLVFGFGCLILCIKWSFFTDTG